MEYDSSSEDGQYRSPALVRQFGGGRKRAAIPKKKQQAKKKPAKPEESSSSAEEEEKAPPNKRPAISVAAAESRKGGIKRILTGLEFKYAPVHDTLIRCSEERNVNMIGDVKMRWTRQAVVAIASILEMKVRKLLETSAIIMGGCSTTLNDKIIAKALRILGENQSLRGYEGIDHEMLNISEGTTPCGLASTTKKGISDLTKGINEKKKGRRENDTENVESAIYRAHQIFVPRVMKYLFVETGIPRSSSEIRHILAHYALNFLGTMVQRLGPILELSKRYTVMIKDVEAANSSVTHSSALLGFGSSVNKRPNPMKRDRAKASAAARKATAEAAAPAPSPVVGGGGGGGGGKEVVTPPSSPRIESVGGSKKHPMYDPAEMAKELMKKT